MKRISIILLCLFLAACSTPPERPDLRFIGVATGTLVSDVQKLSFRDQFRVEDHDIVAIVGFGKPEDGATVQATWFSPDDRRMPMGRTSIVMASGATVARFQLRNTQDWEPAPYMLDIRAFRNDKSDEIPLTASGQLHFFIGLKPQEIQEYAQDFQEWKRREEEKRVMAVQQEQARDVLANIGREALDAPEAIATVFQDTRDPSKGLTVVLDTSNEEAFMPGAPAGMLLSTGVRQFALVNESGGILLAMKVQGSEKMIEQSSLKIPASTQTLLNILASGTVSVMWQSGPRSCSIEFTWDGREFHEASANC